MQDLKQAKVVALLAAEKAGQHLRQAFGKRYKVLKKYGEDFATVHDLIAQKNIVQVIKANFPGHRIVTEEAKAGKSKSDYEWVIDPLDGSAHFNAGIPIFCISIALRYKGEIVLGVVYNPVTRQKFYAVKGQGAFLNNKKIKVSRTKSLKKARVYIETPEIKFASQKTQKTKDILDQLADINQLMTTCAGVESHRIGAWGLALVAMGAFDAYIDFSNSTKLWDVAAGCMLVREAGGQIYELPAPKRSFVRILGTNKLLDRELDDILKTVDLK